MVHSGSRRALADRAGSELHGSQGFRGFRYRRFSARGLYSAQTLRALGRKGTAYWHQVERARVRRQVSHADYLAAPPVILNAFPKSGTHLAWRVASALPGVRDYGAFIASVPAIRHTPRSPSEIVGRLRKVVPGELVRAHLWYSDWAQEELARSNFVQVFVYRDLRDVAVSEAHYLGEMAPWHELHPYFARLDSVERIALAINGSDDPKVRDAFPDIGTRFRRFARWLDIPSVTAVRFEDLVADEKLEVVVQRVAAAFNRRLSPSEVTSIVDRARDAIGKRSHTFHVGRSGGWRNVFTEEHVRAVKDVAGGLLVELGYEADSDWGVG